MQNDNVKSKNDTKCHPAAGGKPCRRREQSEAPYNHPRGAVRGEGSLKSIAKRYLSFDFCTLHFEFNHGYAALTTTILVVVVALSVIAGFTFFALQEVRVTRNFARSIEARYVSEAGIEDGIYRVLAGKQLSSGELLGVGRGTTTIIYTIFGKTRTIRSEGKREAFQQNLETRLDITTASVNFFFGAQVGDLGLTMSNNSSVVGSIYSNGDIIGSTGATVTGDAFVAAGIPATVNQSWEIQNTDVAVGTVSGGVDVAQSFQPTITDRITRVDLFIKKVGSPANATLRIIRSSGGSPNKKPADVLATGALNASSVSAGYSWVGVFLTSTPTLNADTTYWIVLDSSADNDNYFDWGGDTGAGYTRGSAKKSNDWSLGGWEDLAEDLNFRVYMGGTDHMLRDVTVNGNAHAHIIDNTSMRTVGGNVDGWIMNNVTVGGNLSAHAISNCVVTGNAAYNHMTECTILGSQTTPNTPPPDPPQIPLPIPQSTIDSWKSEAAAGGTWNGDYDPAACNVSLGPLKITGNMILDASCSGGQTLTVTGTVWVEGNIDISNNAKIQLSSEYGDQSGVIIADGWIHLSNNGQFSGSGSPGSYLMLLSTAAGGGHHGSAIDLHNNATGAIFYAQNGLIWLHNNVSVVEIVGRGLHLGNNATIVYESGLAKVNFSSGPTGGYQVRYWKKVE